MEYRNTLRVDASAASVVEALSDLATYPDWNDLVAEATPAPGVDGDPGPAWWTTLRARVGPFARSKQLRFARTVTTQDDQTTIVFARHEVDGRQHADWTMQSTIDPVDASTTTIELVLRYDGQLWTGALDPVLSSAIGRATRTLPDHLASSNSR